MTVVSQVKTTGQLPGDSSTFTFSFSPMIIYDNDEIEVIHVIIATGVETLVTEGTGSSNYSISLTATDYPDTGSITYPADQGTGAVEEGLAFRNHVWPPRP
ncbi:hypothetical protein LCGC14_1823900, partial [marine sediment metagenome]